MADSPTHSLKETIQYFRSKASERSKSSGQAYLQAINSLSTFANTIDDGADFASEAALADWLVQMCVGGLTPKTAVQYFNIVAALYGAAEKDGVVGPTDTFRRLKAAIKGLDAEQPSMTEADFGRLLNLTRTTHTLTGEASTATDIMLLALLNGCMPINEIATLKTDAATAFDPDSADIVRRQSSARRKYVFNLNQSSLTARQLDRSVSAQLIGMLSARRLPLFTSVNATIETYWAYAALRSGVSTADIVATLGHAPEGIPFLQLIARSEITPARRYAVVRTVAEVFVDNPYHWYAMRLRPHVSYADVAARLSHIDKVDPPLLFYPYEEITRRTGRKLTSEKRPVIKDVVFFNSRVTDIPPMFRHIGDLAWCYTVSGKTGTTYAAIPGSSFKRFQETIGRFTSDYEVAPIGGLTPRPGDRIVAVGGIFDGLEADICSIATTPADSTDVPVTPTGFSTATDLSPNTIYRLQFFSPNGLEWRLNLDARQTHPTTA